MQRIKLVPPSLEYKEQILDYKMEFIKNNEFIHGSAGLQNYDTFEEWYEVNCKNSKESTVLDGFVPASTFLAVSIDDHTLVGLIDIRHRLNEYLLHCGGHIGYSIRKTKRRKGYATEMLKLALEECKKLKLQKVLVTCDKDNIASQKTILSCNGILENEVVDDGKVFKRYWIHL